MQSVTHIRRSSIEDKHRELPEIAENVLNQLADMLERFDSYQEMVDVVLGRSKGWNDCNSDAPFFGNNGEPINLIPSEESSGLCCSTVLAIANGSRGQTAFKTVVHQLNLHLVRCRGTSIAILLTDRLDPNAFEREFDLIAEHVAQGLVFIPVFVYKGRLQVLDFQP